jgi:hypothetical protein
MAQNYAPPNRLRVCIFMMALLRVFPGPIKCDLQMSAMFDGENNSMGFQKGRYYSLIFDYDPVTEWIVVRAPEGIYCPYSSIESLFHNWLPVASVLKFHY